MYDAVDWIKMVNEPSGFIKYKKIIELLRYCQLLEKNSALWSE
jgi:hypothetical protein